MSIHHLGRMALPTQDCLLFLKFEEIIRCEADGAYTQLFLIDGTRLLVSKNLKEIESQLPEDQFFRAHNSHIVNLQHLARYVRTDGGKLELADGSTVLLARRKREQFFKSAVGH